MSNGMITVAYDDSDVQFKLGLLKSRLADLSPVMRIISGIMADAVEENFENEGHPDRWPALAPSTIAARQRKGYWPGKILQQRGELAASIQPGHSRDAAWAGTNKVYAAIQHFGGTAGKGRKTVIPARPYMRLGVDDQNEILEAVNRHFRKGQGAR